MFNINFHVSRYSNSSKNNETVVSTWLLNYGKYWSIWIIVHFNYIFWQSKSIIILQSLIHQCGNEITEIAKVDYLFIYFEVTSCGFRLTWVCCEAYSRPEITICLLSLRLWLCTTSLATKVTLKNTTFLCATVLVTVKDRVELGLCVRLAVLGLLV